MFSIPEAEGKRALTLEREMMTVSSIYSQYDKSVFAIFEKLNKEFMEGYKTDLDSLSETIKT